MKKSKPVLFIAVFALIASLLTLVPTASYADGSMDSSDAASDSYFEIHYIDVGQGDCILVLCDGSAMLIDGGDASHSDKVYAYLKKLGISRLDYVVATHAHGDHLGGLSGALNFVQAGKVLCPVTQADCEEFTDLSTYMDKQGLKITIPEFGDAFLLGSSYVQILGPITREGGVNDSSIILRITYGATAFLLTGDAEETEEKDLLASGCVIASDVLKLGHHGSYNASTEDFITKTAPKYAVISVGEENDYDHPSESTLELLEKMGIVLYRTDIQGTIICSSDGKELSFTAEKNQDADTYGKAPSDPVQAPEASGAVSSAGTAGSAPAELPAPTPTPTAEAIVPELTPTPTPAPTPVGISYVLNTSTMKFHKENCKSAAKIKDENRSSFTGDRADLLAMGYSPCGNCHP